MSVDSELAIECRPHFLKNYQVPSGFQFTNMGGEKICSHIFREMLQRNVAKWPG